MFSNSLNNNRLQKSYIHYYSNDGLNSVRTLSDDNGSIANTYDYDAFGSRHSNNSKVTVEQRYTYTGREKTSDSELMYYRYRMYDAGAGRWTARDPIGYETGTVLYEYVRNNGVNFMDPFGLKPITSCGNWEPVTGSVIIVGFLADTTEASTKKEVIDYPIPYSKKSENIPNLDQNFIVKLKKYQAQATWKRICSCFTARKPPNVVHTWVENETVPFSGVYTGTPKTKYLSGAELSIALHQATREALPGAKRKALKHKPTRVGTDAPNPLPSVCCK